MELSAVEVRVLGCLIEKEAATPDLYPLSTNGLVAACNQRSSRDPIVSYDEDAVTAAVRTLRERGLARTSRGEGSRVYKHAHALRESLELDAPALAVLSVLMLRGAQTSGELRSRTERQHAFDTLGEVERVLEALASGEQPLVARHDRRPGQKEARWAILLSPEVAAGATHASWSAGAPEPPPVAVASSRREDDLESLRSELDRLRARVEVLEQRLGL